MSDRHQTPEGWHYRVRRGRLLWHCPCVIMPGKPVDDHYAFPSFETEYGPAFMGVIVGWNAITRRRLIRKVERSLERHRQSIIRYAEDRA